MMILNLSIDDFGDLNVSLTLVEISKYTYLNIGSLEIFHQIKVFIEWFAYLKVLSCKTLHFICFYIKTCLLLILFVTYFVAFGDIT